MRITKVYTRTGDKGTTRLAGGKEVWKDSLRVEAYGTVDELDAVIGLARATHAEPASKDPRLATLEDELRHIQHKLLDVGSLLATAPDTHIRNPPQVTEEDVTRLESLIDGLNEELGPLEEFILPAGGRLAGVLHVARTVCRRAERCCVKLSREEPVSPVLLAYINRLGDTLFVFARWVAKVQGESEQLWERSSSSTKGQS